MQAIKPEFERQDVSCYNCGEKGHLGHVSLQSVFQEHFSTLICLVLGSSFVF